MGNLFCARCDHCVSQYVKNDNICQMCLFNKCQACASFDITILFVRKKLINDSEIIYVFNKTCAGCKRFQIINTADENMYQKYVSKVCITK